MYTKNHVVHEPNFDLVDLACWRSFCQQRAKGAPVSRVFLQEKTQLLFAKFNFMLTLTLSREEQDVPSLDEARIIISYFARTDEILVHMYI